MRINAALPCCDTAVVDACAVSLIHCCPVHVRCTSGKIKNHVRLRRLWLTRMVPSRLAGVGFLLSGAKRVGRRDTTHDAHAVCAPPKKQEKRGLIANLSMFFSLFIDGLLLLVNQTTKKSKHDVCLPNSSCQPCRARAQCHVSSRQPPPSFVVC